MSIEQLRKKWVDITKMIEKHNSCESCIDELKRQKKEIEIKMNAHAMTEMSSPGDKDYEI